jgi:hypothetical protein
MKLMLVSVEELKAVIAGERGGASELPVAKSLRRIEDGRRGVEIAEKRFVTGVTPGLFFRITLHPIMIIKIVVIGRPIKE